MRKIISFISRKGGTGKTTNAIQLATALHHLGHSLCLIETDTNYTLTTLRNIELQKSPGENVFPILTAEDHTVLELMDADELNDLDYVIIDSAGKTTTEDIKILATKSDLIVIPSSLTQNDLIVAYQTVEDLLPAKELNPSLEVIVLPNRIHASTRIETVHSAMASLRTEILHRFVPQKSSYAQYSTITQSTFYLPIANEIIGHIK